MFKIHPMNEKQLPSYPLRMPPEVREQIEAAAKASGRSMNAEIVARLEASFDQPGLHLSTSELMKLLETLRADQEETLAAMRRWEEVMTGIKNGTATLVPGKVVQVPKLKIKRSE